MDTLRPLRLILAVCIVVLTCGCATNIIKESRTGEAKFCPGGDLEKALNEAELSANAQLAKSWFKQLKKYSGPAYGIIKNEAELIRAGSFPNQEIIKPKKLPDYSLFPGCKLVKVKVVVRYNKNDVIGMTPEPRWLEKVDNDQRVFTSDKEGNDTDARRSAEKQADKWMQKNSDLYLDAGREWYVALHRDLTYTAYLLVRLKRAPQKNTAYGYLEAFGGLGAPEMSLKFSNSNRNVYLNQLGLSGTNNGPFQTVEWKKLQTEGYGPVGIRVGGFCGGDGSCGPSFLGSALEFGIQKSSIKRQNTTFKLDNMVKDFRFNTDNYLSVSSFYTTMTPMVRFFERRWLEPYMGAGIGLSFNHIHMPRVGGLKDSTSLFLSAPTVNNTLGLVFAVPVGVRMRMGDNMHLLAEARYQSNTMGFDRGGINGEKDSLTVKGYYFNIGLGVDFGAKPPPICVWVYNNQAQNVTLSQILPGAPAKPITVVLGNSTGWIYNGGADRVNFKGVLGNGKGAEKAFTSGTWVWIFNENGDRVTQDMSVLPPVPPGAPGACLR